MPGVGVKQTVRAFTLLEREEEHRDRAEVDRGRAQIDEVRHDARHLHQQHADLLAALGHFEPRELLERHGIRAVVQQRLHIVETVGVREELAPTERFAGLFLATMQVPHDGLDFAHGLAIEHHLDAQHTVRSRVLRAHVELHQLAVQRIVAIHGTRRVLKQLRGAHWSAISE